MEDAHVIKIGDKWVEEEAATGLTGRISTVTPIGFGATTRGSFGATRSPLRKQLNALSPPSEGHGGVSSATKKKAKSGYFAVYDGHGGREAVDFIERNLHRQLARRLKQGAAPQQALQEAFLETDMAMQASRMYGECGSTVASALLRPSTGRPGQRDLYVANVGDARAVVAVGSGSGQSNGGNRGSASAPLRAIRLSRDHTPHDPSEADRVRRAGGSVFRGRVDGQLAVSRALGDHSLKNSGVSPMPDQQHLPLTKDHKFVIVACDGLWDVMSDTEAVNLVSGMKDAKKMADKLVKTALARGTTDNVSAMVVRLQK